MYIKELHLKNYKYFKFSDISELTVKPSNMEIIVGSNGSGKALAHGTPVYKSINERICIENLVIGDEILDEFGDKCRVTNIFPQGEKEIYKITFSDDRTILTDEHHLWQIYIKNKNKSYIQIIEDTKTIKELLNNNLIFIPLFKPNINDEIIKRKKLIEYVFENKCKHMFDDISLVILMKKYIWSIGGICKTKDYDNKTLLIYNKRTLFKQKLLRIKSIEKLDEKRFCRCITVNSKNGLFLAGEYLVTHNTKLMSMYSPLPPLSTMFSKTGEKRLVLEHNNHNYELSYSLNDKKHSFKIDGVELNESGTSQISEELAISHLNYTKLIDRLIFNRIKLTQMVPSARMDFLINSNPINIKFIKEKYVKIVSQLKKYKNQLEIITKKLSEYSSKMMEEIEYEKYMKNKDMLKEFDNNILKLIYKYETLCQLIPSANDIHKDVSDYKILLKNLIHFRTKNTYSPYVWMKGETTLTDIQIQKETFNHKYNNTLLQMDQLTKEIVELENIIKESTDININQLEQQLIDLQNSFKKFHEDEFYNNYIIIDWPPKNNQETVFNSLHNLSNLAVVISAFHSKKIWKEKKYNFHKNRLYKLIQQRDESYRKISYFQQQIEAANLNFSKSTQIYPSKDCEISSCLLKMKFNDICNIEKRKIENIEKDLKIEQKKYQKFIKILKLYDEFFEYQNNYHKGLLKQIQSDIYTIHPALMQLFPNGIDSLIETLNKNLNGIFLKIQLHLQMSNDFWEKKYLLEKIKELQIVIKSKKTNVSIKFAENKIKENYKLIEKLDKDLKSYKTEIDICDRYIKYKKMEEAAIHKTSNILKEIDEDVINIENNAKYEAYNRTKQDLELLHAHISNFIRSMETVIVEQERYKTLYNETLKVKSELDKKISDISLIEKALNPYSGLPSIYTKQYLEKILQNVNYFISQVFTYKLQISLFEDSKDMKYKFNVTVDDVLVGDISNCSDGQMEIIDLSFTLSLMIALGLHKTHPLFLDEVGRCLDSTHIQKLLEMLKQSVDKGYISQLFLINHQAVLIGGFENADVVCLSSDNIVLPEKYNTTVEIH